jgi:hypothetical protein
MLPCWRLTSSSSSSCASSWPLSAHMWLCGAAAAALLSQLSAKLDLWLLRVKYVRTPVAAMPGSGWRYFVVTHTIAVVGAVVDVCRTAHGHK